MNVHFPTFGRIGLENFVFQKKSLFKRHSIEKFWALYNGAPTLCQELSYHQRQLVGVSWGARQGGQAGAHLVVAVTSPDWHNCDVPQSVGLTDPPLPHRRIEICSGRRRESDRRGQHCCLPPDRTVNLFIRTQTSFASNTEYWWSKA